MEEKRFSKKKNITKLKLKLLLWSSKLQIACHESNRYHRDAHERENFANIRVRFVSDILLKNVQTSEQMGFQGAIQSNMFSYWNFMGNCGRASALKWCSCATLMGARVTKTPSNGITVEMIITYEMFWNEM